MSVPAFLVTDGCYTSYNVSVGKRSAVHFYPSLPLDGGETMQGGVFGSSRIESASPTLTDRNGKPQHIPLFSACLQSSAGCHFTAPFCSLFSVLICLIFSISSSPIPSSPAAIRSCSCILAASKQLDQKQNTGASSRRENGACGDLHSFLLS